MLRTLPLLALAFFAVAAMAQPVYGPVYNGLDDDDLEDARPGVRVGLGVGPYIYSGPTFNVNGTQLSDDALSTNLGVTAEVSFPLVGNVYGRVVGGLLNIGADSDLDGDGVDDAAAESLNPFRTSQTVLAEADLMLYLTQPRTVGFSTYVFSGISGLFATGDAADGVETTALAIPVGLGIEYGVSRNFALFAEGSYRFGLTDISPNLATALTTTRASIGPDGVCDGASDEYNREACLAKDEVPFCENGLDPDEMCTEVSDEGEIDNDGDRERFNSGLIIGGLRIGFGSAPRPQVPVYVEPPVVVAPPVVERPVAPPAVEVPEVCDLVELNSVYFDFGSGLLDQRGRSLLDENVGLLLDNPACCVFIDGYTDTSEGDRFGMSLAGRRAQAVYDYYLSRGVSTEKLQVRNRGVAVPACDKEDPGPGCERNRRVESLPVDCERFQFLLDNPSYDPY